MLWDWFLHFPLWWPESAPGYAMGSSWLQLGMAGTFYVLWKRHNCHERFCLRVARHTLDKDGHQTMYCHRHVNKYRGA